MDKPIFHILFDNERTTYDINDIFNGIVIMKIQCNTKYTEWFFPDELLLHYNDLCKMRNKILKPKFLLKYFKEYPSAKTDHKCINSLSLLFHDFTQNKKELLETIFTHNKYLLPYLNYNALKYLDSKEMLTQNIYNYNFLNLYQINEIIKVDNNHTILKLKKEELIVYLPFSNYDSQCESIYYLRSYYDSFIVYLIYGPLHKMHLFEKLYIHIPLEYQIKDKKIDINSLNMFLYTQY